MLEPLVEACRPQAKTAPRDLRLTIAAIIWRHRNGATWRAVPAEYGPWWRAAQLFIRWSKLGAWPRLLAAAQGRSVGLGMAFLDGTSIRAHAKAAGAPKKGGPLDFRDLREALGRSRGGFGTKAWVIADGSGLSRRLRASVRPSARIAHGTMGVLCLAATADWLKP